MAHMSDTPALNRRKVLGGMGVGLKGSPLRRQTSVWRSWSSIPSLINRHCTGCVPARPICVP